MQSLDAVGVMIGLFVVRLGVPLLLTAGLVWWLKGLDARWQAEAWADYAAENWGRTTGPETLHQAAATESPCWKSHDCSAEKRTNCAAYGRPTVPCWLLRLRREGKLPRTCIGCERFARARAH